MADPNSVPLQVAAPSLFGNPINEDHVEFFIQFMAGVAHARQAEFYSILAKEFPIETMKIALRMSEVYRKLSGQTEVMMWEVQAQQHLSELGLL